MGGLFQKLFNLKSHSSKKKYINTLIVSSFFSINLFLYCPCLIYFSNISEFTFSYQEQIFYFILIVLSFILIFTIIQIPLKYSIHTKFISFIFILSFLLWFQGNILVWNYGPLDGGEINWNEKYIYGIIDSTIWLLFFILLFIKPSFIYKIAPRVSTALIIMICISILHTVLKTPVIPDEGRKYSFDNKTKFNFSLKKNVIILILDESQTDVFYELIHKHRYLKNGLNGFTYYPDTLCGYSYTDSSIPNILTGKFYDNTIPFYKFIKNSYLDNSIPKILIEKGFRADIFPIIERSIYKNKKVVSNLKIKEKKKKIYFHNNLFLIDIALFRSLPHYAKKYIYNNNRWLLKPNFIKIARKMKKGKTIKKKTMGDADTKFFNEMASKIQVKYDTPVFKFYHLDGPHVPWIYDENGKAVKQKQNRNAYRKKMHYKLKLTISFLKLLKKKGIYDNSMIMILGDHGAGRVVDNRVKIELLGYKYDKTKELINYHKKARALPLFMVKKFNSTGKMKISDTPIALSDIPEIIFSELDIDINTKKQLKKYNRIRHYMHKPGNTNTLYEYTITGFCWLDKSWHEPRHIYTSNGIYSLFEKITLGSKGGSSKFRFQGWGSHEENYTWLGEKKSSFQISVKKPVSDLILRASVLHVCIPGKQDKPSVNVYIDEYKIGNWKINQSKIYEIKIPEKYTINIPIKVSFEIMDGSFRKIYKKNKNGPKNKIAVKSIYLLKRTGRDD